MNDRKWSWAVALLARHGDQARVLAGGTDLVVGRHATEAPRVVDIKGLTDLPAWRLGKRRPPAGRWPPCD